MKKALVFTLCALMLLLPACSGENEEKEQTLSLPELPLKELPGLDEAMEYINGLDQGSGGEYVTALLECLCQMSPAEQQEVLKESFDAFAECQNILPLESWEISFEDTLELNRLYNEKRFEQIYADIEVSYDPENEDISDESAAVEQFFLSARDALKSNVVGYYRLAGVDIIYRSEDGSHRNDRSESYTSQASSKNELYDAIAWQPEGEREAQAAAYDFVSSLDKELFGGSQSFYTSDNLKELLEERGLEESWNKQIFLSHFGIKDGALYIGVEICSPMTDEAAGSLEQRFAQLVENIKAGFGEYIAQNGLEKAVVDINYIGTGGRLSFEYGL